MAALNTIAGLLSPRGRLVLAEILPRRTQRLYRLVDLSSLPPQLAERVTAAEEAIYSNSPDPMLNWDVAELQEYLNQGGFSRVEVTVDLLTSEMRLGQEQIERWFTTRPEGDRPSFAQHLLKGDKPGALTPAELAELKQLFERQLLNRVVAWDSAVAYVLAGKG
jgi:putative ATPase